MFGPGRVARSPTIEEVGELREAQLATVKAGWFPEWTIKAVRDSHHRVAMLYALGLRDAEVCAETGYSHPRIYTLKRSPAFQDLVEEKRKTVEQGMIDASGERLGAIVEYENTMIRGRQVAARLIVDKLESAEPDDLSIRELLGTHSEFADRTGYPKGRVEVSLTGDFAAMLDRAIAARDIKTIDHAGGPPPFGQAQGELISAAVPEPSIPIPTLRKRTA